MQHTYLTGVHSRIAQFVVNKERMEEDRKRKGRH